MASWKTYFQVVFASKDGNMYGVNLMRLTDDYPTVEVLRPASNPLTTREDTDDSIFTPIRSQSGYLRVIDETGGSLIDRLMPENNTSLMIRVYKGTYSGTWPNGTFSYTDMTDCVWSGFVKSQIYTQPWTDNLQVLELPIVSMLGALKNIKVDPSLLGGRCNFTNLIVGAAKMLSGRNAADDIWLRINQVTDTGSHLDSLYIQTASLTSTTEFITDDGSTATIQQGVTYFEALSRIATLFGFTFRDAGHRLFLSTMHSTGGNIWYIKVYDTSLGGWAPAYDSTLVAADLETLAANDNIQFASTKNTRSLIPGRASAKITFNLNTRSPLNFTLPTTSEDASTVYDAEVNSYNGNIYIRTQPHDPPSSATVEAYMRSHHIYPQSSAGDWIDVYNYSAIADANLFTNPPSDLPISVPTNESWSGAIPIRYAKHENNETFPALKQAWMLNVFSENAEETGGDPDYSVNPVLLKVSNGESVTLTNGYINIQIHALVFFVLHTLYEYFDHTGYAWGTPVKTLQNNDSITVTLWASLRIGNQYWNGSAWTNNSTVRFALQFKPSDLVGNYSSDMEIEDVGGLYMSIPSGTQLTGDVEFAIEDFATASIYEYAYTETDPEDASNTRDVRELYDWRTFIIDDFLIQFIPNPSSGTISERSENTYRRTIIDAGFDQDEEMELQFGTHNNNQPALNFLVNYSGGNVETAAFKIYNGTVGSSGYGTAYQRPEIHLLAALQNYYKKVRSTYTGWIRQQASDAIDWMKTVVSYNTRYFYGIIKQHDWRDGEEEIKLIETYSPIEDE